MAPTLVATTGRAAAIASRILFGNPSLVEHNTEMSKRWCRFGWFGRRPAKTTASAMPSSRASCSSAGPGRAVADEDDAQPGPPRPHDCGGAHERGVILDGKQVGDDAHDWRRAVQSELAAEGRDDITGRPFERRLVQEVRHHRDPVARNTFDVDEHPADAVGVRQHRVRRAVREAAGDLPRRTLKSFPPAAARDRLRAGQACPWHGEGVAVDVVRVQDGDPLRTQEACETDALTKCRRAVQRSDRERFDRQSRGGIPGGERAVLPHAHDAEIEAGAVQPLGHAHRVQLGAAGIHGVDCEGDASALVHQISGRLPRAARASVPSRRQAECVARTEPRMNVSAHDSSAMSDHRMSVWSAARESCSATRRPSAGRWR